MRNKQKGFAEAVVLYFVIGVLALLFVPNPVSKSLGMGIMPNKTVESTVQKVDFIKDKDGNVIATKTTTDTSDKSIQQHVTFWQWLTSLPFLAVLLMGLGVVFPPLAIFLHTLWSKAVAGYKDLTGETKRIVVSIKAGLDTIQDPIVKKTFLDTLSKAQDSSTKDLVKELLKG